MVPTVGKFLKKSLWLCEIEFGVYACVETN